MLYFYPQSSDISPTILPSYPYSTRSICPRRAWTPATGTSPFRRPTRCCATFRLMQATRRPSGRNTLSPAAGRRVRRGKRHWGWICTGMLISRPSCAAPHAAPSRDKRQAFRQFPIHQEYADAANSRRRPAKPLCASREIRNRTAPDGPAQVRPRRVRDICARTA